MAKKIFLYVSIFVIFILNIILDININNYIDILNICFGKNIVLTNFYYTVICSIIAIISILIILSIKLVVFYKKDEIKGIKLKSEDGTYRYCWLVKRWWDRWNTWKEQCTWNNTRKKKQWHYKTTIWQFL